MNLLGKTPVSDEVGAFPDRRDFVSHRPAGHRKLNLIADSFVDQDLCYRGELGDDSWKQTTLQPAAIVWNEFSRDGQLLIASEIRVEITMLRMAHLSVALTPCGQDRVISWRS